MTALDLAARQARRFLAPPSDQPLCDWIEANIDLPATASAKPGKMVLYPYQRGICAALDDPLVERISLLKSARIGATALMEAVIAHYVANSPTSILMVQPTAADARDAAVNVERLFESSTNLRGLLSDGRDATGRSTMLNKLFPGGSLKFVHASPSRLRRITVKALLLDEIDGYELTDEGSAVELAIERTRTVDDRKIFAASTPVLETGEISRLYAKSNRCIWECRCPSCGEFSELKWPDIRWEKDRPETAHWICPSNGCVIEEADKPALVAAGRWRATVPEVAGHVGFKINSLVSLLKNARWSILAGEFLEAKKSPDTLQSFFNLVLGEPWSPAGEELDDSELFERREEFGLSDLSPEILWLTCGVDVQNDRLEVVTLGHDRDRGIYPLAHDVLYGAYDGDDVWRELDAHLKGTWRHPAGGTLGISAAFIDAGDGHHMPTVLAFCRSRRKRRIYPSKGMGSFSREPARRSQHGRSPLWIVGVDPLKMQLTERINLKTGIRFSKDLGRIYFEHMAGERLETTFVRGQPKRRFVPVPGVRHDAWDATVYAWAARSVIMMDADARLQELSTEAAPDSAVAKAMTPPEPSFWDQCGGLSQNYRGWNR